MASILVIGGGLSGLACALRLQRAGHDVEVLERAATPGGRARAETIEHESGSFRVAAGRRVFRSSDKNVRALIDFLGRTALCAPVAGTDLAILREGGAVARLDGPGPLGALRGPALGSRGRFAMFRASVDRARQRRLIDPWQPELAASLDRQSLGSYLGAGGAASHADAPVAAALSFALRSPVDRVSDAAGLLWLERRAQSTRLFGLEGGLDGLVRETAAQLRVRSGVEVTRVESESGGVRVRYRGAGRDRLAIADAAVLAVPAPLVPVLCPRLSPDERGFLDGVRYSHGLELSLLLARPLDLPAYATAFEAVPSGIAGVLDDTRLPDVAPVGAGLVRAVFGPAEAFDLRGEPEEALAERARAALATAGFGEPEILAVHVHRTPLGTPQQRPGSLVRLAAFHARRSRSPRLAFAGDYLIGPHPEGAVTSGLRAAVDAVQALHDAAREALRAPTPAALAPTPDPDQTAAMAPEADPNAETQGLVQTSVRASPPVAGAADGSAVDPQPEVSPGTARTRTP